MLKKLLLALLIIGAYFSLWRPAREAWNMRLMRPAVQAILAQKGEAGEVGEGAVRLYEPQGSRVSILLAYGKPAPKSSAHPARPIRYQVNGGLFLLLPLAVLPFVARRRADYLRLLGFHAAMIPAVSLLLVLGVAFLNGLLYAVDIAVRYAIPMVSMAYVPLLLGRRHL